jgi:hypothetical protein
MKTNQHIKKTKRIVICVHLLILSILSACGTAAGSPGFATWTPSPSATATCSPNITLSTPVGWGSSSQLIVFLFDPHSIGNQYLELSDGQKIQDISSFINRVLPKLIRPGDEVSGFRLGYRSYEAARVTRLFSYISRPQLYNTPAPRKTLTPIIAPKTTVQPGLVGIATTNALKAQATAHAATAIANDVIYTCEVNYWNNDAKLTATAWKQTEVVEIDNIGNKIIDEVDQFEKTGESTETPYTNDDVYDGLAHASIDIATGCKSYDICTLLIFDDLHTWAPNNPNNLKIDLTGVNLYVIMPNCKDINQPSCTKTQTYWNAEFKKYGANEPKYMNGIHLESELLKAIGR